MSFSFDSIKAQNVILFLVHSMGGKVDVARLFLFCYLADQQHLARHGVMILGDTYLAMIYGPVPYRVQIMFKQLPASVGDITDIRAKTKAKLIMDPSKRVVALYPYNAHWLSKTEVQCIFDTIQQYKDMSFEDLSSRTRSSAWEKANNGEVHLIDIAYEGGAKPDMISYIRSAWADELLLSQ